MFKLKDEYRLELQTPETIKLFSSIKKINWQKKKKKKNGENSPSLEVVEVVLVNVI